VAGGHARRGSSLSHHTIGSLRMRRVFGRAPSPAVRRNRAAAFPHLRLWVNGNPPQHVDALSTRVRSARRILVVTTPRRTSDWPQQSAHRSRSSTTRNGTRSVPALCSITRRAFRTKRRDAADPLASLRSRASSAPTTANAAPPPTEERSARWLSGSHSNCLLPAPFVLTMWCSSSLSID